MLERAAHAVCQDSGRQRCISVSPTGTGALPQGGWCACRGVSCCSRSLPLPGEPRAWWLRAPGCSAGLPRPLSHHTASCLLRASIWVSHEHLNFPMSRTKLMSSEAHLPSSFQNVSGGCHPLPLLKAETWMSILVSSSLLNLSCPSHICYTSKSFPICLPQMSRVCGLPHLRGHQWDASCHHFTPDYSGSPHLYHPIPTLS